MCFASILALAAVVAYLSRMGRRVRFVPFAVMQQSAKAFYGKSALPSANLGNGINLILQGVRIR